VLTTYVMNCATVFEFYKRVDLIVHRMFGLNSLLFNQMCLMLEFKYFRYFVFLLIGCKRMWKQMKVVLQINMMWWFAQHLSCLRVVSDY